MSNLLTTESLSNSTISRLLEMAQCLIQSDGTIADHLKYKGITLSTVFFEPSTRTRCSFELAAQKLGMYTLNVETSTASIQKGESVLDTLITLEAMGSKILVVRHPQHGIMQEIVEALANKTILINAGEGSLSHPTQALLDIFTIWDLKKQHDFSKLSMAVVGDSAYSRVARSTLATCLKMGMKDIRLIGPKELLMPNPPENVSQYTDLKTGLKGIDVIMGLRLQKERMASIINEAEYVRNYQLNRQALEYAKSDAIIMHPGPMNRGIEISDEVADHMRSAIRQQVRNGVVVRMAIMDYLLSV